MKTSMYQTNPDHRDQVKYAIAIGIRENFIFAHKSHFPLRLGPFASWRLCVSLRLIRPL